MKVFAFFLHGRALRCHSKLTAGALAAAACLWGGGNSVASEAPASSVTRSQPICNSSSASNFSLDSGVPTDSKIPALSEGWSRVKLDLIPTGERSSRSERGYPSVKVPQGTFGVEGHGLPRSVFYRNGDIMSASELASVIIDDSRYQPGMTVYLMCCETGKGRRSFAQQLANALGTEVVAPTEKLWPLQSGMYIVAPERRHGVFSMYSGEHMADTNRLGRMKTFKPGRGSTVMVATSRDEKSQRHIASSSAASPSKTQETAEKQSLTGMAKTAALLAELQEQRNSTRYMNSKLR